MQVNQPPIYQGTESAVKTFLNTVISKTLSTDKFAELICQIDDLRSQQKAGSFYIAFSKAVRIFGKNKLNYTSEQIKKAQELRKDWTPPSSVDKAVRLLILLEIPVNNETIYMGTLENLFGSGDVGELVALYSSLPLLPYPEKLITRCTEGIRTNMGEVFEAIANDNPFPAEYLSEDAFNQMVLKCLFVGKPLYKVTNLHHRLNKKLALMASDYAHERWAAQRKVNPELWQLVAPFMETRHIKDIQHLAHSEDELEKQAATIVCAASQLTEAEEINALSNYRMKTESGELNWYNLGVHVWRNN